MSAHGGTTLDELYDALAERGIEVHRATVGRLLHRLVKTPLPKYRLVAAFLEPCLIEMPRL